MSIHVCTILDRPSNRKISKSNGMMEMAMSDKSKTLNKRRRTLELTAGVQLFSSWDDGVEGHFSTLWHTGSWGEAGVTLLPDVMMTGEVEDDC